MIYYVKDSMLYCSESIIADESFVPISEQEYTKRLENAVKSREKGNPDLIFDAAED